MNNRTAIAERLSRLHGAADRGHKDGLSSLEKALLHIALAVENQTAQQERRLADHYYTSGISVDPSNVIVVQSDSEPPPTFMEHLNKQLPDGAVAIWLPSDMTVSVEKSALLDEDRGSGKGEFSLETCRD